MIFKLMIPPFNHDDIINIIPQFFCKSKRCSCRQ